MCEVEENCYNYPDECWICKFKGGTENNYWPQDKKIKHPQVLEAKRKEKFEKLKNINKERSMLVKKAAKTEEAVKKSLNSGRVNKDGDLHAKDIVIDVKLQSTRENPTIDVGEFEKVQGDANRIGKKYGVLEIVNKSGKKFVVIPEEMLIDIIS